jgi:DNA end-binding protein Ku
LRKPRPKSPPEAAAAEDKRRESRPASGRSVWTGQLRLALVSIPVQLVSAVKTGARLSFHQIDAQSHKRIRYEKVAPGIGKVEASNIVKGFELSKGNYVLVTEDDLEQVKIEARRTIDLVQFVDHCEVDPIYFEKPYYVIADGKLAEEAYGVLRDALRETGKMGLGQFVMRGREYVAALKPCGNGLMLETLRFADEVRAAAPFFADAEETEPNEELLDLAKDLIQRKTAKFQPGKFHDHYTEALRSLIEAKAKHQIPVDETADEPQAERGNVIDLVEALRQSVAAGKAPAKGKAAPPKDKPASSAKTPARRRRAS